MISLDEPKEFNPKFEAAGCFLEFNKRILLLLRQDHKPDGNTWGLPSGKVNDGEDYTSAIIREVREETNIKLENVKYFERVYVKFPEYDFIYHIFSTRLDKIPRIRINNLEHKDSRWVSPKDALKLHCIRDLDACIKFFYKL